MWRGWRRILTAGVLAAAVAHPAWPQDRSGATTEVTLPEARLLAQLALREGKPAIARDIAMDMIKRDPKDIGAYNILAAAHGQMGDLRLARIASRYVYRYSDTDAEKYAAARLAGAMALKGDRLTLSQVWLRRAALHAETPAQEAQLKRDYDTVRRLNPWSFKLNLGLRPSNNVNNGADTALQIIDGVPITGFLSGSAQALSGLIATTDLSVGYRLRQTDKSRTTVGGRLYVQRVALSSEAKTLAPNVESSDLGTTYAEMSVDHLFAVGTKGGSANLGLALGQSWAAEDTNYTFGRLSAGRKWRLGRATQVSLSGSIEERNVPASFARDSLLYQVEGGVQHRRKGGDILSLSLSLQEIQADHINVRSNTASLRASYAFAQPIGPARMSAGVVLGQSDYPDYRVGFIPVPGGRQDTSVYGDVNLFFPDYDFAGFAPTVRFRTGRKSSNVSRFDTRETSVSLGIQSKF